ncbi:PD-(D/E)XK motif protein [Pseudarthrobacter sp. NBSH8]|uniref:PD-(D/E)XK motif protein n=1 Tax=Pseudarthrobacter sp. NBSH8 TaxID=2596911 RepID=UPI00162696E1|nr:PD-(D/E)XK motif protein [Pseudarthrobacter sp. NBSH8]QNE13802.1 PD-(D/E)XK motif protein [Pseudarthrobacter sp. NBSH8]
MRESSSSVFDFLAKDVSAAGSFHSRKSGISAAEGEVLCAVDAGGRPTVLVPVEISNGGPLDWHSKSLSLQTLELVVDGVQRPFMILRCIDPKLHHQFGLLADDVLNAIELDPERAPNAVSATLDRWKNLFEADRGALLGPEQLAGIMAELSVLHELVRCHGPQAISAWQGPHGNRHDFVFADCSIEVKATTNHNNMVVTIHGGRQLAAPDRGDLYLRALQLERSPNGTSVPGKVEELIALGVSRLELLTVLGGAHYSDAESSAYEGVKFSTLSTGSYLVDVSFPRITAETLIPSGTIERLGSISYSIDLGHMEEADLDLSTVLIANSGQN